MRDERRDHFRFAARLGFTIDPGTLAAIRELAPRIHSVSPERQRDELTRILIEGGARRGFELLDEAGLLHELLPEIEAHPEYFATVKVIPVTGEAFPLEVKQRILKALPHVRLYSFFAMTEVGGLTLLGPDEQFTHPTSLGRLNPGAELKLLDAVGKEVAPGEVGEMWIRTGEPGRWLTMRCYFNKPKETAETIRDGWVATGDMARRESDGHLYIMDRKKDMVLSGGYNIYSKEVELVLQQHAAVLDAAIIGVPDPVFGEAVTAFVELRPGASATEAEIIEHCRERIASYKKPKHVRFLAPLPRNSTGKVQKFELRKAFVAEKERSE